MQAIENVLITPIKDLLSGSGLGVDILLAIVGVVAVAVVFLISLLIKNFSLTKAFTKKLMITTASLLKGDEITEENVEELNNSLKTMPEAVQRGWGCFLDQKIGYPSDYILARDVLTDKKFSGRNKTGKTFLGVFSALIIIITIWIEYLVSKGDSLSTVGLADFTSNFELVGAIIAAFCAPLLFYIIFNVILNAGYNNQYKKLEKAFSDFQNALDDKVIIYAEEEDEFVSENIGEINAAIEEILSNKLENKEIIEIVTAPKQEEKEIIEVETVEEPIEETTVEEIEEIIEEEVEYEEPVFIERTEEEKKQRLEGLIAIIDQAVFHDPEISKQDIEELAIIIDNERNYGLHHEKDRDILEECLRKLAAKHSSF